MPNSSPFSILVIEDDASMRSSLRRILKLDGYVVEEAATAAEALARDEWDSYFAVILDRKLPDGSAEVLLPKIRSLAPHAAVLIVTGNADLASTIEALRQGAADYLMKPIEPESLRARLRGLASLRAAQVELLKRETQLKFMVENLPAGAAYVDFKSGEVQFNNHIERITGYSPLELSSLDSCFRLFFNDRATAMRAMYNRNRESWMDKPLRLKIRRRDGVERVIEFRGYHYDDHEVWMLQDVTERDLHDTELRIRDQAIQAANEGVVISDVRRPGHPIIFVNRAFEKLSGYSADEAIGRGCDLLCGDETPPESIDQLKDAIDDQLEIRSTLRCRRKNGESFWNEISIAPVRASDDTVTHLVIVMEDVTERRRAEQQLLQSERLAAIGQMVTGLAHESRNALQRAQACLDMLTLDLEDQPEQLELTRKTHRALQDLYRHYEEVRNYAAPVNLQRRLTDVSQLWRNTWRNLQPLRAGRRIELVEAAGTDEIYWNIDEHRIEQVFRNIMENAVAACGDEGCVNVACCIEEQNETASLRISFQDDGPGIDEDTAAKVFQPFFTTRQRGTGLGMPIAKRIVEAHGGQISICGMKTGGTEVIVKLPKCAS